jgi:hypothetical protein
VPPAQLPYFKPRLRGALAARFAVGVRVPKPRRTVLSADSPFEAGDDRRGKAFPVNIAKI